MTALDLDWEHFVSSDRDLADVCKVDTFSDFQSGMLFYDSLTISWQSDNSDDEKYDVNDGDYDDDNDNYDDEDGKYESGDD